MTTSPCGCGPLLIFPCLSQIFVYNHGEPRTGILAQGIGPGWSSHQRSAGAVGLPCSHRGVSGEWIQSRQMTLATRKSTKRGAGQKMFLWRLRQFPRLWRISSFFFVFLVICGREGRRERAFIPLKVLVRREVLLAVEGIRFLGKIIFRFSK